MAILVDMRTIVIASAIIIIVRMHKTAAKKSRIAMGRIASETIVVETDPRSSRQCLIRLHQGSVCARSLRHLCDVIATRRRLITVSVVEARS